MNGLSRTYPVNGLPGDITVNMVGRYIQVQSFSCGVSLKYDGLASVKVMFQINVILKLYLMQITIWLGRGYFASDLCGGFFLSFTPHKTIFVFNIVKNLVLNTLYCSCPLTLSLKIHIEVNL